MTEPQYVIVQPQRRSSLFVGGGIWFWLIVGPIILCWWILKGTAFLLYWLALGIMTVVQRTFPRK